MNIRVSHESARGCGYAWAAGYYEGEGSVTVNHQSKNRYPSIQLSITSVDREPLERFISIVGFGHLYGPYPRKGQQPQSQWRGHGFNNLRALIKAFEPWLSPRRLKQLNSALATQIPVRRDYLQRQRSNNGQFLRKAA